MYSVPPHETINSCDSESEASNIEEDEDEVTRIIPPEGNFRAVRFDILN